MSNPDAYVREIGSLDTELKRLSVRVKALRCQKKEKQVLLCIYMERNSLEKYGGLTLKSVTARQSRPRKPAAAKKDDAMELFRDAGIDNPSEFWDNFKATQTYTDGEDVPPKKASRPPKSKAKKDEAYDPFLGF